MAFAGLANAHGYVYSWGIDGQSYRGFNPDDQQRYKGAERPTDNSQAKGNGWGKSAFSSTADPRPRKSSDGSSRMRRERCREWTGDLAHQVWFEDHCRMVWYVEWGIRLGMTIVFLGIREIQMTMFRLVQRFIRRGRSNRVPLRRREFLYPRQREFHPR